MEGAPPTIVLPPGMGPNFTLQDALHKVKVLGNMELPPDRCPDIDGTSVSVEYVAVKNTTFVDKGAFQAGPILEQATRQAKLDELLEEGNKFSTMVYTWRSCSLGIPQVTSHDQANRMDIYEATVEVLQPEIDKLKALMDFREKAAGQFCEEVARICKDPSMFVSQAYLLSLGKLINMFAALNELKNIKASLKNDFSTYRRAADITKRMKDPEVLTGAQRLSMFLATNDSIVNDIKERIQKIPRSEDVLSDIASICVEMYDNHLYLLPAEKHALVKVTAFCLFLMDGQTTNINKLDGKRLKLHKIDKVFKKVEAVPLFGDMMIGPFRQMEKTPNYTESNWPQCNSSRESTQADILKAMPQMREEYTSLMAELAVHGPNLEFYNSVWKKQQMRAGSNKMYYDLALRTLHTLSSWTAKITEMFSWKLLHPTSYEINKECPESAKNYEKATRYNYSPAEKNAMTEVVAMIKSVQKCVLKLEKQFTECGTRHIYAELQDFVQVQLREPLRKALKAKKKDQPLLMTLRGLRDVCSDLSEKYDPGKDPLWQGKKDVETGYKPPIDKRAVPPSSTQLYLLRTMLESLVDKSAGKKSMRKELKDTQIAAIEGFLKTSHFWIYIINFSRSLTKCCDLSQFWYREFYLEMEKKMQFPIEMSMPWILANHILESKDSVMMEYVLYPLDLYNDSAQYALHNFKKQFLYDEIEAEVDLCFDQLVFKLSDQIFAHFKKMASIIYMGKAFKDKLAVSLRAASREAGKKMSKQQAKKFAEIMPTRYATLLKQQHVTILGREVDLKRLIGQRINIAFVRSLEVAIAQFESADITKVMELDGLLELNQVAHRMLSKYLELDQFEALFQEANQNVNLPLGKIGQKIFYEVTNDFLPQYCYNGTTNRYVRAVFSWTDAVQRDSPPSAAQHHFWGTKQLGICYKEIYERYSNFVGQPHFDAMIKWLNYQEIALIIQEMINVIKNDITNVVMPYTRTMMEVFPKRCILPIMAYTSTGILRYYQENLESIITYTDLASKFFQNLRELGNAVLFCLHLEQALTRREVTELKEANLFMNVIPKPFIPRTDGAGNPKDKDEIGEELKKQMHTLQKKFASSHLLTNISKYGTEKQTDAVKENLTLTREKLCGGLSIFEMVLRNVKSSLDPLDELWAGPQSNEIFEVNDNKEFHRLWSALQFVYCLPQGKGQITPEEMFGEGLQWSGCTLMVLLEQHRRFNMMDFCYHLVKAHRLDNKDEMSRNVNVRKMVDRIRKFQHLNDQIFGTLEKYLNKPTPPQKDVPPPKYHHPLNFNAAIHHFNPPTKDHPTSSTRVSPVPMRHKSQPMPTQSDRVASRYSTVSSRDSTPVQTANTSAPTKYVAPAPPSSQIQAPPPPPPPAPPAANQPESPTPPVVNQAQVPPPPPPPPPPVNQGQVPPPPPPPTPPVNQGQVPPPPPPPPPPTPPVNQGQVPPPPPPPPPPPVNQGQVPPPPPPPPAMSLGQKGSVRESMA